MERRARADLGALLAICLVIAALYLGRPLLMPLALALLVTFLLAPLVGRLERVGLGRTLSVLVVLLMLGTTAGGIGSMVARESSELADEVPQYRANLRAKIKDLRGPLGELLALLAAALFAALELVTNNVLEPWLYGSSAGLSLFGVVFSAIFWASLWGIPGLLLATPLTVCLVVAGRYVRGLEYFAVLLGDRPALLPEVRLYQRLLALDLDEGAGVLRKAAAERSLEAVSDAVILPAAAPRGRRSARSGAGSRQRESPPAIRGAARRAAGEERRGRIRDRSQRALRAGARPERRARGALAGKARGPKWPELRGRLASRAGERSGDARRQGKA